MNSLDQFQTTTLEEEESGEIANLSIDQQNLITPMMVTRQRKMEKLLKSERRWGNRADEPLEFPAAKFRYLAFDLDDVDAFTAVDQSETEQAEMNSQNSGHQYQHQEPVTPLQKIIARLISRHPKSSLSPSPSSSPSSDFPFEAQQSHFEPDLECNFNEIETLLKSATGEDTVPVHSEILGALLRNVASLQVHNSQLAERLKSEKVAHERLQLLQSEQCQALSDQVEHLEAELIVATRHQVTCSICLDSVDEILTSSPTTPKRSLLVTFCGHLFCDLCLKRSVMATCCYKQQQQLQPLLTLAETAAPETVATTFLADGVLQMTTDTDGQIPSRKHHQHSFSCPRCRKTLGAPSTAEKMVGKFAHQLFV